MKKFTFKGVNDENTTQEELFNYSAVPIFDTLLSALMDKVVRGKQTLYLVIKSYLNFLIYI